MTHILIVAPAQEQILHNVPIFDNTDVKKVEAFVKSKEQEYGEVVRILFSLGVVRVMRDQEEIPVPRRSLPRGNL